MGICVPGGGDNQPILWSLGELLGQYAWYLTNTPSERAQPCGSLLPNDLGLFDMLGNMYEWCNGRYEAYPPDKGGNVDDNITIHEYIKETNPRLIRGGTFFYIPAFLPLGDPSRLCPVVPGHLHRFPPLQDFPKNARLIFFS